MYRPALAAVGTSATTMSGFSSPAAPGDAVPAPHPAAASTTTAPTSRRPGPLITDFGDMSGNDRLLPVLRDTQTAEMQRFQRFPAGSWPGSVLPDAASCCVRAGPDRLLVL